MVLFCLPGDREQTPKKEKLAPSTGCAYRGEWYAQIRNTSSLK